MKPKIFLTSFFLGLFIMAVFPVMGQSNDSITECHYCYVKIEGKVDKRISVEVDMGDSQRANAMEDLIESELKRHKSYVQVLQYFLDKDYKLEKVLDQIFLSSSGGGSEGIAYIFKRPGVE